MFTSCSIYRNRATTVVDLRHCCGDRRSATSSVTFLQATEALSTALVDDTTRSQKSSPHPQLSTFRVAAGAQ